MSIHFYRNWKKYTERIERRLAEEIYVFTVLESMSRTGRSLWLAEGHMFLQCFYPDHRAGSVYQIDFQKLYEEGVRGVLFDIDNTLAPHGAPADGRVAALFERLRKMGLKTCLISNNQMSRVLPFARAVGSDYICNARKPSGTGYRKAMERIGTTAADTVFVGDQLFTDVYGAKRAGIPSWLVKPVHPKEEIQIMLKRCLEWFVLYFYERERKNGRKKEQTKETMKKRLKS